ncbi:hypothetical protein PATSB16_12630 [Pandoraea thiooxydans]|nr:hypothetical protein PATSB16_12630 [Pandoraea thiooxydans]
MSPSRPWVGQTPRPPCRGGIMHEIKLRGPAGSRIRPALRQIGLFRAT